MHYEIYALPHWSHFCDICDSCQSVTAEQTDTVCFMSTPQLRYVYGCALLNSIFYNWSQKQCRLLDTSKEFSAVLLRIPCFIRKCSTMALWLIRGWPAFP